MILAQTTAKETSKNQATSTSHVEDTAPEAEQLFLAIDAEWQKMSSGLILDICCSMSISGGPKVIFLNSHIQDHVSPEVYERTKEASIKWGVLRDVKVHWLPFSDRMNLVKYFLDDEGIESSDVNLRMFYSPKDLTIGFGFGQLEEYIRRNNPRTGIQQRRNVMGFLLPIGDHRFTIMDLRGLQPVGGLKDLAKAVGYKMRSKSDMDEYKDRMLVGLIEKPEVCLDYALYDADDLHPIHDGFNTYVKDEICKKILGIELEGDVRNTVGSIVGNVVQQWLHSLPKNSEAFEFAIRKLGILDPGSKTAKKERDKFNRAVDTVNSIEELESKPALAIELHSCDFRTKGYSQAGVHELARNMTTAAFNSLVHGGRCVNENPYAYTINCAGADIDLQGCYSNALSEFIYPIGLPTLWGYTENQKRPTLKQWLEKNESDLVDGLWQVVVSGDLSFNQDLIYSKLVELKQIHAAVHSEWKKDDSVCKSDETRDNDLKHIPGEFVLILPHIENGVITADLLKAIRAISTNNELKEWMGLEVVCASAYRLSDRVDDIDEWSSVVIADPGRNETVNGNAANLQDNRTRKWVGIPIADFIGPLVKKRIEIKELAKSDPALSALNLMLKLFINSLYGVLASIYFDIGNAVVANNITARARLGSWMISKALWTSQSITDGGPYNLSEIPFLDKSGPLPGFGVLSDRRKWIDRRRDNRTVGTLDNRNWNSRIYKGMTENLKDLGKEVDALALAHINQFWGCYGLELPFQVEHKHEHFFVRAAYWAKAHYGLDLVQPCLNKYTNEITDRHFIIRGAKTYKPDSGLRLSPMFKLLGNILDGVDEFPADLDYDHFYLLKTSRYLQFQNSGDDEQKKNRPGDGMVEKRTQRFNNTHFPLHSVAEYRKRADRKTSKTVKGVREPVRLFEKYGEEGISEVHQMMMLDQLK